MLEANTGRRMLRDAYPAETLSAELRGIGTIPAVGADEAVAGAGAVVMIAANAVVAVDEGVDGIKQ